MTLILKIELIVLFHFKKTRRLPSFIINFDTILLKLIENNINFEIMFIEFNKEQINVKIKIYNYNLLQVKRPNKRKIFKV